MSGFVTNELLHLAVGRFASCIITELLLLSFSSTSARSPFALDSPQTDSELFSLAFCNSSAHLPLLFTQLDDPSCLQTRIPRSLSPAHPTAMPQSVRTSLIYPTSQLDRLTVTENTIIVVLGASGDLAKKKVRSPCFLSLLVLLTTTTDLSGYLWPLRQRFPPTQSKGRRLCEDKDGPAGAKVLSKSFPCSMLTPVKEFEKRVTSHLKADFAPHRQKLPEFLKCCSYVSGQYDKEEDFQSLTKTLVEIEDKAYGKSSSKRNRVFYMALPPNVFIPVAENLKKACYSSEGINRIIVEKPFGRDLQSARDMMGKLKKAWAEDEVLLSVRSFHIKPSDTRADLPYRSLPRQGNGQEPPRRPLRQRIHRFDLQQELCFKRSDHLQGALWHRGTRRLL